MREQQPPVDALIDRIVTRARIPSRGAREDLRRELRTHFEEAGGSPDQLRDALQRFGDEGVVIATWRRLYRREYALWYAMKVAASIAASLAVALVIEVTVNVRVEPALDTWRLAPAFSPASVLAAAVVLGLVAAWEAVRQPRSWARALVAIGTYGTVCVCLPILFPGTGSTFAIGTLLAAIGCACCRLESRSLRLLLMFGLLAAVEYGLHLVRSVDFGPARAVRAGAVLTAVWLCTVVILTRVDHSFGSLFEIAETR